MWFKLSLLVLVCVMMVVLNFAGMHPRVHQLASKSSNTIQVVEPKRENTTMVSFSLFWPRSCADLRGRLHRLRIYSRLEAIRVPQRH
jgi:hypothetical protein